MKGVITGVIMVILTLVFFYSKVPGNSKLSLVIYAVYAGGITWTLLAYYRSPEYTGKFGDIFGKGFRCFIIITLIMVTFVGIFSYTHPEFAEEDAKMYRIALIEGKNTMPDQIDKMVKEAKESYTVRQISGAVFGTLILGAMFTAAGAGLLLMRRK